MRHPFHVPRPTFVTEARILEHFQLLEGQIGRRGHRFGEEERDDTCTWVGEDVGAMDGDNIGAWDMVELGVENLDETIVDVAIVNGTPIVVAVGAIR